MLRVLIVDDERLARAALRRILSTQKDVEIIGEAENIQETLREVREKTPNLVFMDIELRNSNGFDIFDELKKPPIIVFVTAYSDYAVRAFSVNAADYLLKPVSPERLTETLDRIRQRLLNSINQEPQETNTIELKTPGRSVIVTANEIAALKADRDFTHVILTNQPEMMICRTLIELEKSLSFPNFLRLGRSIIINIDHVRRVIAYKKSSAKIELEGVTEQITLGPAATTRLRKALSKKIDHHI